MFCQGNLDPEHPEYGPYCSWAHRKAQGDIFRKKRIDLKMEPSEMFCEQCGTKKDALLFRNKGAKICKDCKLQNVRTEHENYVSAMRTAIVEASKDPLKDPFFECVRCHQRRSITQVDPNSGKNVCILCSGHIMVRNYFQIKKIIERTEPSIFLVFNRLEETNSGFPPAFFEAIGKNFSAHYNVIPSILQNCNLGSSNKFFLEFIIGQAGLFWSSCSLDLYAFLTFHLDYDIPRNEMYNSIWARIISIWINGNPLPTALNVSRRNLLQYNSCELFYFWLYIWYSIRYTSPFTLTVRSNSRSEERVAVTDVTPVIGICIPFIPN